MEVILREHVDNLGRRGDVVKVADGYARNFLLPRKLALPVNEQNRRQIERERKVAEARELQDRQDAEAIALKLGAVELVLARRVGEHDALYGSVTSADIAEALAEKQFDIEKRKVVLPEPLKQVGEFEVAIKIHRDVPAHVKVKIIALGAAEQPAAKAPAPEPPGQ
jgi:large subunit ribosomal protein L9